MSHLRWATDRTLAALEAVGVRATADPRNVNPPVVLVTPDTSTRRTTAMVEVRLTLDLIAPGPANLDAIHAVDALEAHVTPALDAAGIPWQTGLITTTPSPSSGDSLLTYQLAVTIPTRKA